jgi:uncharacterized low-complexity protein
MRIAHVILTALSLSAASPLFAAEKRSPTDEFRGQTQYQIMMCSLKVKLSISEAQLGTTKPENDPAKCIKEGKAEVKKVFPAALKSVSKNPVAGRLIKDYYAAWLTAFDAILPRPDDLKVDYERRQAANEAKYDEVWNRLEIEAGL